MALAGALIVMSGLAVLSFVISQLHKVAALLEGGLKKRPAKEQAVEPLPQEPVAPQPPVFDLDGAKADLKLLAADLGETFELAELYTAANRGKLPHVHLSIRSLRESGVIVPAGEGRFAWRD
jgi:hypothetical protein